MADDHKPCFVDGCNKNAHWRAKGAKGMCHAHYKRTLRHGSPTGGAHRADNSGDCSIEGCDFKAKSLGMCSRHYQRYFRNGCATSGRAHWGEPGKYFADVVVSFQGDDCLIWPYSRNACGYGTIYAQKGQSTIVSRRACEERHGPPPIKGAVAAHSCGKGREGCVNPNHLRWATPLESAADKVIHGTALKKARGDGHNRSKLTSSDVISIRANRGKQTTKQVAEKYGVKPETIKAIYSRRTWRHLP